MNKLLFSTSIIINAALLMAVTGVLPFLLFCSCVAIFGLLWYLRRLFNQMRDLVEDLEGMMVGITEFSDHIESIHELEMFYGDTTIQGLLRHSRAMVEDLSQVVESYSVKGVVDDEEEEE